MEEDFITVKIGSMYYRITADEDKEYVREVAKKANELLAEIRERYGSLGDAAAAVLALLNAIDRGTKLASKDSEIYENLRQVQKELEESLAEQMRLRENLWECKKDLIYYRNLCEMYEERLDSLPKSLSKTTKSSSSGKDSIRPLDRRQRTMEEMETFDEE